MDPVRPAAYTYFGAALALAGMTVGLAVPAGQVVFAIGVVAALIGVGVGVAELRCRAIPRIR